MWSLFAAHVWADVGAPVGYWSASERYDRAEAKRGGVYLASVQGPLGPGIS
jgi:hypothetical protein